jgi:Zn-dependent protease/CBS domain-containing protein
VFSLPSFRLGRLFGIPLEINVSWLFVFALISAELGLVYFPSQLPGSSLALDIAVGVITALLFFASVVAHEFSHSLVAKAQGAEIDRITLFLFGGVSEMTEEPAHPGQEFVMAVAGPGMSILLAAVLFLAASALSLFNAPAVLFVAVQYLAIINLSVGVFNLLPGFPMDGGRVVRAILWGITGDLLRATRWAARTGQALGYTMIALGILGVVFPPHAPGLIWLVFLGWFLAGLADSAYQQQLVKTRLSHVPVSAVMSGPVVSAPADLDLARLVDDYFLGQRHSRYPITSNGDLAGMVSLSQVKAVPRERWSETRAIDVAERDLPKLLVRTNAPVDSVLERLTANGPGALLAVDEQGDLAGIVTRTDVVHGLQRGLGES